MFARKLSFDIIIQEWLGDRYQDLLWYEGAVSMREEPNQRVSLRPVDNGFCCTRRKKGELCFFRTMLSQVQSVT
jgi:hypothetical protein